MTEQQRATMRDMLEMHRDEMLERAAMFEAKARACRAVADKDAKMIARICDAPMGCAKQ